MRSDSLGLAGSRGRFRSWQSQSVPGSSPGRPQVPPLQITTVALAPCGRLGSSRNLTPDPERESVGISPMAVPAIAGRGNPALRLNRRPRATPFPAPSVGFRRSARPLSAGRCHATRSGNHGGRIPMRPYSLYAPSRTPQPDTGMGIPVLPGWEFGVARGRLSVASGYGQFGVIEALNVRAFGCHRGHASGWHSVREYLHAGPSRAPAQPRLPGARSPA
jgi:hypothetical protein